MRVVNEKDDDIRLLLAGGGDVREMKKLFYEFDKNLDEIEEKGNAAS